MSDPADSTKQTAGQTVTDSSQPSGAQDIVIMTGPAGSGRSTAIGALEDLGFEAIDNLPMSLLPRLFSGPPMTRPLVVGIDPRNRDFDVNAVADRMAEIAADTGQVPTLVFLDCDGEVLRRRYSETRRRHPLSPRETPTVGIGRELALLAPLRARADLVIDTSQMTPHDLRAEMKSRFGGGMRGDLAVSLLSFSFKRGAPGGLDMLMDVRFLRNPYWDADLRPGDGRDQAVRDFVEADPAYEPFYNRLLDMLRFLLPAYRREGKAYFALGLGCTGGRHRSVALVETLAAALAAEGWQVAKRHRELESGATGVGVA